jgi:ribonuclease D
MRMQVDGKPVQLIQSASALEQASALWLDCDEIALDTEFMRVRTFYASAALFQVCDGRTCYLVDPLAVAELEPLARVLRAPGVLKVMHSCSEDLEVCQRRLGALPEPLYDTQVAAAFCGHGLSVGYQKMLEQELGLVVEKSETRTDWLQRPLSDAQLHYAAEDVAHLLELRGALEARLEEGEKALWVREECAAIVRRFRARDPASEFRSVSGAWRLDARALAVLQRLYRWRDETAREKDLPRNWIVPDRCLLQLAQQQPRREEQLAGVPDLPPGSRRRYARVIVAMIEAALAGGEEELPGRLPPPLDPAQGRLMKKLRALVQARAHALGIAPEMLARRRDFEDLVRAAENEEELAAIPVMQGWRRRVLGEEMREQLRAGAGSG